MFSHVMVGADDLDEAKRFYDALFVALGGEPGSFDPKGRLGYSHDGARFMVTRPIDGGAAMPANGGTIGFRAASAEQAVAWFEAGVANGGTAIEEPPSRRPNGLFLAYLRDPAGNKLCALHRDG